MRYCAGSHTEDCLLRKTDAASLSEPETGTVSGFFCIKQPRLQAMHLMDCKRGLSFCSFI